MSATDRQPAFAGLRVVHAASYHMDKDGASFFGCDLKFHQGLVQAGCLVVPFSINDRARMLTFTNSKTFGSGRANRALLKTCVNVRPDALIVGHGQSITRDTLLAIRHELPDLKIGYWYVDPLWEPRDVAHLHERADLFDAICCTTAGPLLKQFCRANTPAAFVPNPVDSGIERLRAFECPAPRHDLVFFGRDKHASHRGQLLAALKRELTGVRCDFFGCLGERLVFAGEKDEILAASRMGLNLSRRTDVELYSSDRIAQLTGNGLTTLIERGAGFEQLYSEDEVAFYAGFHDLVRVVRELAADDTRCRAIARAGWQRAHGSYSSQKCAEFLLNLTFRRPEWRTAPWACHVSWLAPDQARPAAA
jgi:glycosyltransferase involved in cell wall biosynthesis